MDIKIIDIIDQRQEGSKILGKALIEINEKMKLWFSIIKNKHGKPYCLPASININGKFMPSFELSDLAKNSKFCFSVTHAVTEDERFEC